MEKLDLTKKYKPYFTAKEKPEFVDIEQAQFISITGKGDPSEQLFSEKIQALHSTAYALKFIHKAQGQDFTVSKLEGLWTFDEKKYGQPSITEASVKVPRSEWEYRLLIRMPDYVKKGDQEAAVATVLKKKGIELVKEIEFYTMAEGNSVQMLHVGPFSTEPKTLKIMEKFMQEHQLKKNGLHHEIYLSGFTKTEPNKLKTILREPVK